MKTRPVKYIAQINGVRELGLWGAADLAWWREHLAGEGYEPLEVDGRAQVAVSGLDAKWLGIPMREMSVVVSARCLVDPAEPGFYFAGAFNASRFFACTEKWWFHTPYTHRADLHVSLGSPVAMRLGGESDAHLLAELGPREPPAESAPTEQMGFTSPLFLPTGDDRRRRWFMAKIEGQTSTFDFDADSDRFEINAASADTTLTALRASGFRGIQWQVRRSATHARSKTFTARC